MAPNFVLALSPRPRHSAHRPRPSGRATRSTTRLVPTVEDLEGRQLLANFLVTSSADSGPGTLRGVLSQANGNGQANVIQFQDNIGEIDLTSGPLAIQNDLTIVGPIGGVTVARSLATGTPAFRIFQLSGVPAGNSLRQISVRMESLTIARGQAFDDVGGGGILNSGQKLTLVGCTLSRNASRTVGGGLLDNSMSSSVTIQECTIIQNSAQRSGGGIYSQGGLSLARTSVIGNSGPIGGGLYKQDVAASLENCTFQGNKAIQAGGAMFLSGAAQSSQVLSCTIAQNPIGGGIVGGATLFNTIVASNDGGDLNGTFLGDSNLIGDGSGGLNPAVNHLNVDPRLSPLQDNDGPTPTMALLPGSPAINTGRFIGLDRDQRRHGRPALGGYDIGAFEFGSSDKPSLVVTTAVDVLDYGDGLTSLREAVAYANTAFVTAHVTFDPVVFRSSQTITLDPGFGSLTLVNGTSIIGPEAGVTLARSTAPGSPEFSVIQINGDTSNTPSSPVRLERLTVTGGASSGGFGGGITVGDPDLTLVNCTIIGNSAFRGGGVYAFRNLTILNTTIANNQAIDGGGVYAEFTFNASNSTISGNTASSRGGGLYSFFLRSSLCTIVRNSAATGGGIFVIQDASSTIQSSIIAQNAGGDILGRPSGTTNLVGDDSAPQITTRGGFSNVGDPRLGPLQNNGGITPTMALLPGSPALNVIPSNLGLTDQRGTGFDRVVGGRADLGAYEAGNPAAIVVKVTAVDPPRTYGAGEILTLRVEFTQDVVVTGVPRLVLNSGGTAVFKSMASKQVLNFEYEVRPGDSAPRLDSASLKLAGGTIRDAKGVDVDPTLPDPGAAGSLAANARIAIDTAPVVRSYRVLYGSRSFDLIGSADRVLPWQVTGIQAVFSEPIASASTASLAGISATGLSGLGTNTLTWTFAPITAGTSATSLLGTGPSAIKDATGTALSQGAGFTRAFKVLYGDFNGDGSVSSADMSGVFAASVLTYNPFADLNGDGVVDVEDVRIARSRIGSRA